MIMKTLCKTCRGTGKRTLPSGNAITTCDDCQGEGGIKEAPGQTPAHYRSITGITPWDFCAGIQTSGNPFADHLRCSAIEYAFRIKEDPSGDLVKAANCLLRAAAALDLSRAEMEGREQP